MHLGILLGVGGACLLVEHGADTTGVDVFATPKQVAPYLGLITYACHYTITSTSRPCFLSDWSAPRHLRGASRSYHQHRCSKPGACATTLLPSSLPPFSFSTYPRNSSHHNDLIIPREHCAHAHDSRGSRCGELILRLHI